MSGAVRRGVAAANHRDRIRVFFVFFFVTRPLFCSVVVVASFPASAPSTLSLPRWQLSRGVSAPHAWPAPSGLDVPHAAACHFTLAVAGPGSRQGDRVLTYGEVYKLYSLPQTLVFTAPHWKRPAGTIKSSLHRQTIIGNSHRLTMHTNACSIILLNQSI